MAWLGDNRERIKEENPKINVKEVAKIGGERWKTAADKRKYEEKASAEFEKYKKAFAEYKKTNPQSKKCVICCICLLSVFMVCMLSVLMVLISSCSSICLRNSSRYNSYEMVYT